MSGNGGANVLVFPTLELVAAVTSTNCGQRGMREVTDRLVCVVAPPDVEAAPASGDR